MAPRHRTAFLASAIGLMIVTSGCARVRDHQGYIFDETLSNAIQPGVDNRDSVQGTLGRPTFVGQFTPNDWYYVSRNTRQAAFTLPRPIQQTVLKVSFDQAGNVAGVQRTGIEEVVSIMPMLEKTPTLGRDRSFFDELFSNVGQVGALGGGAGQPQ